MQSPKRLAQRSIPLNELPVLGKSAINLLAQAGPFGRDISFLARLINCSRSTFDSIDHARGIEQPHDNEVVGQLGGVRIVIHIEGTDESCREGGFDCPPKPPFECPPTDENWGLTTRQKSRGCSCLSGLSTVTDIRLSESSKSILWPGGPGIPGSMRRPRGLHVLVYKPKNPNLCTQTPRWMWTDHLCAGRKSECLRVIRRRISSCNINLNFAVPWTNPQGPCGWRLPKYSSAGCSFAGCLRE